MPEPCKRSVAPGAEGHEQGEPPGNMNPHATRRLVGGEVEGEVLWEVHQGQGIDVEPESEVLWSTNMQLVSWMGQALCEERREVALMLSLRHRDLLLRLQHLLVRQGEPVQTLTTGQSTPPLSSDKSGLAPGQAQGGSFRPPGPSEMMSGLLAEMLQQLEEMVRVQAKDEQEKRPRVLGPPTLCQAPLPMTRKSLSPQDLAALPEEDGEKRTSATMVDKQERTDAPRPSESQVSETPSDDFELSISRKVAAALDKKTFKSLTGSVLLDPQVSVSRWKLTLGYWLDVVSGIMICLNTVVMAMQTEYNSFDLAHTLVPEGGFEGARPSSEVWPHMATVFFFSEWLFGIFFCVELLLRVGFRLRLWVDARWNLVDLFIVVAWAIESLQHFNLGLELNLSILRTARLIRLMRLVKLLRHVHLFDSLHLIIQAIQSSVSALIWTVALLLLFMMVVAMLITSLLEPFVKDPTQDGEARKEIYRNWGSFLRAYVAMFEISLANWGPPCWRLMNLVDAKWGLFFILWRCCFGFAIIQVITSVFIQHTFKVASRDEDIMIQERQKASENYLMHLDHLFSTLDESGDGSISREEFEVALQQPRVRHWFAALEIDVSDLPKLFLLLDDGDGLISKAEFIDGLKKVKGVAQSIDLLAIRRDLQRLRVALSPKFDALGSKDSLGEPASIRLSIGSKRSTRGSRVGFALR